MINSAPFTDMAQSLQASFAEAGINFEILPGTGSQVITKYRDRSHQAMLLYWGPDFMDPHSNAKAFAYNADNSDGAYAATTTWRNAWAVPEEMNALTLAALSEPDPDKRLDMYVDLQKQVQAKSPIVIMFQAAYQVAMDKDVTGYVNGATSDFVYYRLVEKGQGQNPIKGLRSVIRPIPLQEMHRRDDGRRILAFGSAVGGDRAAAAEEPARRGRVDDRRVFSGIVHVLKVGCCWRDCPEVYGPSTRLQSLQPLEPPRHLGQDLRRTCRSGGFGRGHQHRLDRRPGTPLGGGWKGAAKVQGIGRSRGGPTTKIHALTDGCGRIVAVRLTPGNCATSAAPSFRPPDRRRVA